MSRLRDPIRQVLAGQGPEALVLEGHDRRGKVARFTISFAPLDTRAAGDEVRDDAIVLVTAEVAG